MIGSYINSFVLSILLLIMLISVNGEMPDNINTVDFTFSFFTMRRKSSRIFIQRYDKNSIIFATDTLNFKATENFDAIILSPTLTIPLAELDLPIMMLVFNPYFDKSAYRGRRDDDFINQLPVVEYNKKVQSTWAHANNYDCKKGTYVVFPESFICMTTQDSTMTIYRRCNDNQRQCWGGLTKYDIVQKDGKECIKSGKNCIPRYLFYTKYIPVIVRNLYDMPWLYSPKW
jgi:hypothetical protein